MNAEFKRAYEAVAARANSGDPTVEGPARELMVLFEGVKDVSKRIENFAHGTVGAAPKKTGVKKIKA